MAKIHGGSGKPQGSRNYGTHPRALARTRRIGFAERPGARAAAASGRQQRELRRAGEAKGLSRDQIGAAVRSRGVPFLAASAR
jgi:hypothetical protein